VVKRPGRAPALPGAAVAFCYKAKHTRFDVYLPDAARAAGATAAAVVSRITATPAVPAAEPAAAAASAGRPVPVARPAPAATKPARRSVRGTVSKR
jgi:hypothetical protein